MCTYARNPQRSNVATPSAAVLPRFSYLPVPSAQLGESLGVDGHLWLGVSDTQYARDLLARGECNRVRERTTKTRPVRCSLH